MNVLKNFKQLKSGGFEEFPLVSIRYEDTEVFTELPICIVPYGFEFKEPILTNQTKEGLWVVREKEDFINQLETKTKKIYFTLDENKQPIKTEKETSIFTRLPKDYDDSNCVFTYENGLIYVIEKQKEETNDGR